MLLETAILAGALFGCGIYLILQASFVRVLFGFVLLSNAANLVVLAMSGSPAGKASPIVLDGTGPHVDPLPQALILTAIVIGFGLLSYLVVLLYRIFVDYDTTDAADLFDPNHRQSGGGK